MVVAVIGILASLLLSAVGNSKAKARETLCTSNLRQFGLSFQMYASDFSDYVVPNKDGRNIRLGDTWVEGWLGVSGPDCTNTAYLQQSLLASYLGSPRLWQCPTAQPVREGAQVYPRVRTLSINGFLGPGTNVLRGAVQRLSALVAPGPAETFVFMDERPETINDGAFSLQNSFDRAQPGKWMLRDKPAVSHRGGAVIVYADGHVATKRWVDPRTRSAPRNDAIMPGNPDVLWLNDHSAQRSAL